MKPRRHLFWLPGSLSLFCLVTTSPLQAQILQDATLPNPSIVTANDNTSVITGGTQDGPNLFHSFREFSIPTGKAASFQQIDQGISNVISRVTGSNVSNINGLISVLQANGTVSSANFFLLNPNGIIFGPKAELNIGGSFLASTASSLNFADGRQFSATANPTTPLLTVSVPIGLQFGGIAGSIRNQSQATNGLQVQPGKTLALVGGDIALEGGSLTAEGGRIELGSIAGKGLVSLNPIDKGWALGYEDVQNFQDIQLSQHASVDVSGSGGGDIQVQGAQLEVMQGSFIFADTSDAEAGGEVLIQTTKAITLSDDSFITADVSGSGDGGNLTIETGQLIVRDGSTVQADVSGSGDGGNLTVRATDVELVGGIIRDGKFSAPSGLFTEAKATGAAGNLSIFAGKLTVRDGAKVASITSGVGRAGNLTVRATDVELVGGIIEGGDFLLSGLFTQAAAKATGDGGKLSISAGKLIVRDGAQVNSTTSGVGRAGDLTVRATDIELVGDALSADGKLLTNNRGLPFPSGLVAGTDIGSGGDGGTLKVETKRLSLRDGAVLQTSTLGAGDAGNLIVQASESVELIGTAKGSQYPTSLLAVSGGIPGLGGVPEATGQGGDLTIETGELIVQDGAAVAVSSLNPTSDALGAGKLQVQAQTIRLDNQGKLTAETASGQGGDITLQDVDLLLLRHNSNISATAGTSGAGGDGGNITIDTSFLITVPSEDSNISANAFEGRGGNVKITAQGIFGTQFREEPTLESDITASSEFGVQGEVEINTPDVDPSQGLVALPEGIVDVSGLIAQGCSAGEGPAESQFVVTGRGGLPPNPGEVLSSNDVWKDWRSRTVATNPSGTAIAPPASRPQPAPIVEAQGWVIGDNGEVVLTATAPTVTLHIPWLTPADCHAR